MENELEIIEDIKNSNYCEKDVEKLLYELDHDTGRYSIYDIAKAIIYYRELYKNERNK